MHEQTWRTKSWRTVALPAGWVSRPDVWLGLIGRQNFTFASCTHVNGCGIRGSRFRHQVLHFIASPRRYFGPISRVHVGRNGDSLTPPQASHCPSPFRCKPHDLFGVVQLDSIVADPYGIALQPALDAETSAIDGRSDGRRRLGCVQAKCYTEIWIVLFIDLDVRVHGHGQGSTTPD